MQIETRIPLLDEILNERKTAIGDDFAGYRNHVYRMVNFCFALDENFGAEEREKIVVAGCFHDIGIWTGGRTLDYLPPSIDAARAYLSQNKLEKWIPEITRMIDEHHKLRECRGDRLTEVFREGDLVDFSLGLFKCGLPKNYVAAVKKQFPNNGFHKFLARLAGGWICRHPLNPLPIVRF
ncbi:MAG TPA: HD domain-containing protein [Pyrinomonadaceae bacterium]